MVNVVGEFQTICSPLTKETIVATKAQEQKVEETVFPDKISLRCFLEDVEELLPGHRVPKDKVHIVLDLIKKNFPEENLPEENWIPDF